MSVLSDEQIIARCQSEFPMISPFFEESVRTATIEEQHMEPGQPYPFQRKIISYGVSSYGYDVRLAEDMKIFTNVNSAIVDPKKLDEKCYVQAEVKTDDDGARYVLLPPNSFLLGHTVEYIRVPRDILVVCLGKSTWARAGAIVNVTPLEPEWHGNVVIEVSNTTNLPIKIYANEGIAQFIFLEASKSCKTSYADRGGKYQGQTGVQLPKV